MKAIGVPAFVQRGWSVLPIAVLAVAVLAVAVLAGAPPADQGGFPARIPMANAHQPSGVAVDKPGNVYVSVREYDNANTLLHNVIWKYTPDGTQSFFAELGTPATTIYGLYAAPNGDIYAAMMGMPGTANGVYRLDRKGNVELLPGSSRIVFPNGLAFDDRGNLYVTESFSLVTGKPVGQGGVWRIPRGGEAEIWVRDALLTGIGLGGNPPVGANGIAYYHGDLFVTNTDKHLVLRIPIEKDGSAGPIETWKTLGEVPEAVPILFKALPAVMPDGLALDVHGNLYMTILTRNAVIRVMADDRRQETVAVLRAPGQTPSTPLDMPASLAFGTGAGEQQNLFVTNLGWMKTRFFPSESWPPGPALVKVDAGVPGRPLK